MKQSIQERVIIDIANVLGIDKKDLNAHHALTEYLGTYHCSYGAIASEIEDSLEIDIPINLVKACETLGDFCNLVEHLNRISWTEYSGNYEKQEYDIWLKSGRVIKNCWPNAGRFHDLLTGDRIEGDLVESIRPSKSSSFSGKCGKKKHLKFCLITAYHGKRNDHPLKIVKKLGITYQHATPQSMGDMWQFWNCENVPDDLPKYLTIMDTDPMDMIGFGLSVADAVKIRDNNKC